MFLDHNAIRKIFTVEVIYKQIILQNPKMQDLNIEIINT